VRYLDDISQVSYSERSGTILPELQLHERIVITRDKVTLTRNGMTADTEVHEGEWEIEVDEQAVTAFFEQLEAIDCSSIKRIEPDQLDIGGGTETYKIVYGGDRKLYMDYGRGVTHRDGELIVEPIDTFIKGLEFPFGATSQYKASLPQPTATPLPPPPTAIPTATPGPTNAPAPAPTTVATTIPEMTNESTPAPTTTLEIINSSPADIGHVYLAPSYSDQWGDDLLGGKVIADGESFTLSGIPSGTYDVKAETGDHATIEVWYEQVFDGPRIWAVLGGDGRFLPRLDQWAFAATASSERSSPGWSAGQASGEPDTSECGDLQTAWASSAPDGVDWLELQFPLPVAPRRVNIHETHSPGFVVRVEVIDGAGQIHTVWEGDPAPTDECPRVFSFLVTETDVSVQKVRVHLDQREGGNWNQIDAVELLGLDVEW
jgi:hypothetical protein